MPEYARQPFGSLAGAGLNTADYGSPDPSDIHYNNELTFGMPIVQPLEVRQKLGKLEADRSSDQ